MAITRRLWRATVTMEPDGSTIESVEFIGYVKPADDPDNPGMEMPEKQVHKRFTAGTLSELTATQKQAVVDFIDKAAKPGWARTAPINPGPGS